MTEDVVEILLVEDNPNDEELTLHAFRKYHLTNRMQVVRDGEEALDFIFCRGAFSERNIQNGPKVVLLDIKLPKVDGLEVLRQIKADERTRKIPVVLLTSSREEQDVLRTYDLGVNAYVVKPVVFSDFVNAVKVLGQFWAVINEPPPPA